MSHKRCKSRQAHMFTLLYGVFSMKPVNMAKEKRQEFLSDSFEYDVSERIPLGLLISKQIDRINNVLCTQPTSLPQSVLGLELLMCPLSDNTFIIDLKKMKKVHSDAVKSNEFDAEQMVENEFDYAVEKLRLLYILLERRNFYPERDIEFDIDADYDNTPSDKKHSGTIIEEKQELVV